MTRNYGIGTYVICMDRRTFTQSLAALFAMPAIPVTAAAAPVAAVATVPSQARFWAIYMSALHGTCTPRALQVMLNISASEAQGYLTQLIAQGVITPSNLSTGLKAHAAVAKREALTKPIKEKIDRVVDQVVKDDNPLAEDPIRATDDAPMPAPSPELQATSTPEGSEESDADLRGETD